MNISIIIAAIALPFSVLSGLSGYLGFKAAQKQHSINEYRESEKLKVEVNIIKRTVQSIYESQKQTHTLLINLSERTARIEEAERFIEKQNDRQDSER